MAYAARAFAVSYPYQLGVGGQAAHRPKELIVMSSPIKVGLAALALAGLLTPALAQSGAARGPKPQHQYVTVDEYVRTKLPAKTLTSVEGYVVLGVKSGAGFRLDLTDSTDKVLTAKEADATARASCHATVPAALARKPGLAWSRRGVQRFIMFTGAAKAQKKLNDMMPKLRVTGQAAGKGVINPVTLVEYTDDNGDWRPVR